MTRYCLPSRRFFGWLSFQLHRVRCAWCAQHYGVR